MIGEDIFESITMGVSSAFADFATRRDCNNEDDYNLTDDEIRHIVKEVFYYVTGKEKKE